MNCFSGQVGSAPFRGLRSDSLESINGGKLFLGLKFILWDLCGLVPTK